MSDFPITAISAMAAIQEVLLPKLLLQSRYISNKLALLSPGKSPKSRKLGMAFPASCFPPGTGLMDGLSSDKDQNAEQELCQRVCRRCRRAEPRRRRPDRARAGDAG